MCAACAVFALRLRRVREIDPSTQPPDAAPPNRPIEPTIRRHREEPLDLGASVAFGAFKIDVAYLHDLAAARTGDIFGKVNDAGIVTVGFDYAKALSKGEP